MNAVAPNLLDIIEAQVRAEKELITAILYSRDTSQVMEALQIVNVRHFDKYGKFFQEVVKQKLEGKNPEYNPKFNVSDIISEFPVPRHPKKIAQELKKTKTALDLLILLDKAKEGVTVQNFEKSISEVQHELVHLSADNSEEVTAIKPLMEEYSKRQEEYRKLGGGLIGISTGIPLIDEAIDGIRPPHLWVIAGYTSLGKTFLTLNILLEALRHGKPVVFYSLEMSKADLISRLLSIISADKGISIMKGKTSETIERAKDFLANAPLKLINERRELSKIILSMYEEKMVFKAEVFFIDYLQQIFVERADTEYESMRDVAMQLQTTAEKLATPIVTLSQISNEAAKTPGSSVMGFKGSGTIASAADFALELISGEKNAEELRRKSINGEPVKVQAVIKKNRHGKTGVVPLIFHSSIGRFEQASDIEAFFHKDDDDF